jgi:hypothetical protein
VLKTIDKIPDSLDLTYGVVDGVAVAQDGKCARGLHSDRNLAIIARPFPGICSRMGTHTFECTLDRVF